MDTHSDLRIGSFALNDVSWLSARNLRERARGSTDERACARAEQDAQQIEARELRVERREVVSLERPTRERESS